LGLDRTSGPRNAEKDPGKRHEEVGVAGRSDPFSLVGRTAVVCGGGRGIGREAARVFARAGADIVVADLDQESMDETAALVDEQGKTAMTVLVDVSSKAEVDALGEEVLAAHGKIDVWANVAGLLAYGPIVEVSEDDLERVIGVNLKGVYWGSAAAARAMAPAGSGSIINIASAGGDMAVPGGSVYALTKAAVMHFTRSLAAEIGPSGVRANSIAPGWVETPMTAVLFTDDDGHIDESRRLAVIKARSSQSPLSIVGTTEDIAWAMWYLASDAARYVTGQVIRPNGGVFIG
jgi:3-oxoacyl-[acyl-carrier protein] reductase